MKVSRAAVATVAACLTVGLAGAPSAMADTAKANAAASTPSTKTINKRLNTARKQLSSTRKSVSRANRNIRKVTTDLGAVAARLRNAEGGLGTLLGAAPTLISSLTQLGEAVRIQIGPGLIQLSTVVRDQVAPALTRIGEFVGSQEYGAVIGRIELPGGTVQTTSALVSPDIPDTGNPGQIVAANAPVNLISAQLPAGLPASIGVRGAIRSAEIDGAATGNPAGQIGGLLVITCLAGPCQDAAGTAKEPGELVCTAQTPESDFALPDNKTTKQRLVNIQEKVAVTDTSKPDANSTDVLGSTCGVRTGAVYGLSFNGAAADIPTSAAPGPKD